MKPARFAMPVWLIVDTPALKTAPGQARRVTAWLAMLYWLGGCRPLPTDEFEISGLAGLHPQQWARVRERVLTALGEVCPQLDGFWAERTALHACRAAKMEHVRAARKSAKASAMAYQHPVMQATAPVRDYAPPVYTPQRRGSGVPVPPRNVGLRSTATFSDAPGL